MATSMAPMTSQAATACSDLRSGARTTSILRARGQKVKDFLTLPLRAFTLFEDDRWGLTSLQSERFEYVARRVRGECLDVGCGRHNRFIEEYCHGRGQGIDVYPYAGLTDAHIVDDISQFPFDDASFDTVTFIASINHIPRQMRDVELAEAFRCLRHGGNIIITMGNPLAEVIVHQVIYLHDKLFGTHYDVDSERGMVEGESYYLTKREIRTRLASAGFVDLAYESFGTQWGLNGLHVGWKR